MIRTKINISLLFLAIVLGAIGCNPGIIEVPPPQVTDASGYFWKNQGSVYFLDSNRTTGGNFLHLTLSSPVNDSLNVFSVTENIGTSTDIIKYTLGTDAVSVSGITTHSFIPLPDGYQVKANITLRTQPFTPPLQHIIGLPGGIVIASNNDSGLYVLNISGTSRIWSRVTTSWGRTGNSVTVLSSSGKFVYAGTDLGNLFSSADGGKNWKSIYAPQFNGSKILAIATDPATDTMIYVSLGNNSVYHLNPLSPGALTSYRNSGHLKFTSLAFNRLDSNAATTGLLLGGTDIGLYFRIFDRYTKIDTSDWQLVTSVPGPVQSVIATLGSLNGFYCTSGDQTASTTDGIVWNIINRSDSTARLLYDNSSGSVISWTNQGKFQSIAGGGNVPPALGKITINDFAASGGNYFAATDSGAFTMIIPAQTLSGSSEGITSLGKDSVIIPGEVVLLHSQTVGVSPDSSWLACTLASKNVASIPITARIVGHLDHVTMHDSTVYNDVIEVQYSFEQGAKPYAGIPYWRVYYAKGIGPIIVYEISNAVISNKIYRSKF